MSELFLDGIKHAREAHLIDGTVLQSVTFVRATGYDITLWVKGTAEDDTLVLAPRDMIVKVVVK